MLSWMDAASGVLGVRVIMCECHELYKEQWSREWKGLGRWRGGVVMVDVQAGGAHHTQIDIAPLLDDVGSFRSQTDARRIEHLVVEQRSDPEGDLLMPQARARIWRAGTRAQKAQGGHATCRCSRMLPS